LAATLALSAVSTLLCGLAPALQSTRVDLVNGLNRPTLTCPDATPVGPKYAGGRAGFHVPHAPDSIFPEWSGVPAYLQLGTDFAKDHLLMTSFDPRLMQYNPAQTQQFYNLLAERAREMPGVKSVALTENVPLGGDFHGVLFVPDGFQMPRDREKLQLDQWTLPMKGTSRPWEFRFCAAAAFLASDTADTPRVAVVNEQFAKHYWPGSDVVGKYIRLESRDGTPVEIVGVAKTIQVPVDLRQANGFCVYGR